MCQTLCILAADVTLLVDSFGEQPRYTNVHTFATRIAHRYIAHNKLCAIYAIYVYIHICVYVMPINMQAHSFLKVNGMVSMIRRVLFGYVY